MSWLARTVDGIAEHGAVVRVTVVRADGSTPREVGAAMLVTAHAVHATIGGGALELAAIAHARSMLARSPLSPPPSGPPQSRAHPTDPEGDGERDGVRGSQGLQPVHGGSERRLGSAPSRKPLAERISLGAAPHPNPLPASGERGSRRRLEHASRFRSCAPVPPGAAPIVDAQPWQRDVRAFPLGPSLGQCCGGHVKLLFEVFTEREREQLVALADLCKDGHPLVLRPLDGGAPIQAAAHRKEHRPEWPLPVTRAVREMLSGARPHEPALIRGARGEPAWLVEPFAARKHPLYLYGAGHVGRAVVRALQGLPFAITWVDTSQARFPDGIPPHARAEISADPTALAGTTAAGAFHIVLTYSHALDLAICHSLLRRGDFRFLGLIGSSTKRARFIRRLSELGIPESRLTRLVCPIGLPGLSGKEPAVIAVSVAAQLIQLAAAAETQATLGREEGGR